MIAYRCALPAYAFALVRFWVLSNEEEEEEVKLQVKGGPGRVSGLLAPHPAMPLGKLFGKIQRFDRSAKFWAGLGLRGNAYEETRIFDARLRFGEVT
jgi:hypothetical protein